MVCEAWLCSCYIPLRSSLPAQGLQCQSPAPGLSPKALLDTGPAWHQPLPAATPTGPQSLTTGSANPEHPGSSNALPPPTWSLSLDSQPCSDTQVPEACPSTCTMCSRAYWVLWSRPGSWAYVCVVRLFNKCLRSTFSQSWGGSSEQNKWMDKRPHPHSHNQALGRHKHLQGRRAYTPDPHVWSQQVLTVHEVSLLNSTYYWRKKQYFERTDMKIS